MDRGMGAETFRQVALGSVIINDDELIAGAKDEREIVEFLMDNLPTPEALPRWHLTSQVNLVMVIGYTQGRHI
jgi:hypothetical protein